MIEILSPGAENVRRDRVAKLQLYAKHGVAEYWIVDPKRAVLEVYRLKAGSLEFVHARTGDDEVSSQFLPGFACVASSIFKK